MWFFTQHFRQTKLRWLIVMASCFFAMPPLHADPSPTPTHRITSQEITTIAKMSHLKFNVTPEVVAEINFIRSHQDARLQMLASLQRMQNYKPYIQKQLRRNAMPSYLLALPLIQSGYRPLDESIHPFHAAGIWQFSPSMSKECGLIINAKLDERLNTARSTEAAIVLLGSLYEKYHDWRLAMFIYEFGDEAIDRLIQRVHSHNPWTLARSKSAPKEMKRFMTKLDAAIILINNPKLLAYHEKAL
ncbi:MAG: transglycosylase SLT domain-containing protein [Gammaproteobacteria bacterium]|nr:transglycosylase SLT domain-containing protein [Gammaproteobacteria bacterium]